MPHPEPKVCVLPYGRRLGYHPARLPLDSLLWPLGQPDGIAGKTLADLSPDDHLLIPPHTSLFFHPSFGTKARVSVVLLEPRAVHRKQMDLIRLFHRRFFRVLTGDSILLASCPNAAFFPVAGSWVEDWDQIDLTKTAMCSLIASEKTRQAGHKLRHSLVRWCRDTGQPVEILGRGYKPFAAKSSGLAPYRFSVVIENVREQNYFSEKLVDALLCRTVPIYWGCPNITDFFDPGSMILCQSEAEIRQAITRTSDADYTARLPALNRARDTAAQNYTGLYGRAARALLASV